MRIMLTGGGTGGHTSPAVAVIEELRRRDPQLLVQWVGKKGGLEESLAKKYEVPFRSLPVEGWPRNLTMRKGWVLIKLAYSMFRAWFYLKVFRPQAVFGVGGYVSLPALWVAQRMGIMTFLHEQNKRLGLANRLCAAKATKLLLSYPETEGNYPQECALVVGNPVRQAFINPPDKGTACTRLELQSHIPTILIVGGSQGAHRLNEAAAAMVHAFKKNEIQLIWSTGKADFNYAYEKAKDAPVPTKVFAFIEDMATACAAADLIISRAGASATAEIAVMGKPSILVPFPYATDNHQEYNARAFQETGAALLLPDTECTGERLAEMIRSLLQNPEKLATMGAAARTLAKPFAAEHIAEIILEMVYHHPRIT